MKTQMHTTHHRLIALAMAIAMALTLSVSALASANEPYNVDTTKLAGSFSSSAQTYSATVSGPMGTTKTKIELTLYEKGLLGYKEVDSASARANSRTCSKTVSYAFKDGKSYKLTVTGSAYVDGQWDTVTKNFTASF